MKTPSFWYQDKPSFLSKMLEPLGELYAIAGHARRATTKPYRAPVPVICVGNIVAGGAGKTPTTLALVKLLKQQGAKPAIVLRGYGGSEKGPLRVDPALHDHTKVGDEALLLAQAAPCWIGVNRAAAIAAASVNATHILMDDGLQNPTVAHDVSFLVIDGASGLGNELLIPAGPLREKLCAALKRVSAVIMVGHDQHNVLAHIPNTLVLHAKIDPKLPNEFPFEARFIAFSGIARPEKFYTSARNLGLNVVSIFDFPDHHVYTAAELSGLINTADEKNAVLLTTEKDFVRLPHDMRHKVTVLPIEMTFAETKPINEILQSDTVA